MATTSTILFGLVRLIPILQQLFAARITVKSNETSGDQSGYFNIKTWIEWEDPYVGNTAYKHLAFEVDQAVLMK